MVMPTLFISHGSPMLALEETPTRAFLRALPARFEKPSAIIIATAHWETDEPAISATAQPEMIYDFYGFPKALYELDYPAKGAPELAHKAAGLMKAAGLETAVVNDRGFDHGAWSPLMQMYPDADVPVVQLAIQPFENAAHHANIGRALRPLREEGVLIIGSGSFTHNLREAFGRGHTHPPAWVSRFQRTIAGWVEEGDVESLLKWTRAEDTFQNHPTPEHFLPFFVALGAASEPLKAERMNSNVENGVLAMDAFLFE